MAAAAYLILSADTFKTVIGKGELVAKQRILCWTHLGKESYLQYDLKKINSTRRTFSYVCWSKETHTEIGNRFNYYLGYVTNL